MKPWRFGGLVLAAVLLGVLLGALGGGMLISG